MSEQDHNRRAWDEMVRQKQRFARPASDQEFAETLQSLDPHGWLEQLAGRRVLCLAAGGGRQGPIYASAGAMATVVDISAAQLELDREVATQRKLQLRTVQTSMDDLSMFASGEFDIVIQPVSTCYVSRVEPVYLQVARVLRPGGLYVSQHKQPNSLQASTDPRAGCYVIEEPYYRREPLPPVVGSLHREAGTLEYVHRWEELIGGLCKAGFVIEDLVEPNHARPQAPVGSFGHRSQYVAPYVRIKARRTASNTPPVSQTPRIVTE